MNYFKTLKILSIGNVVIGALGMIDFFVEQTPTNFDFLGSAYWIFVGYVGIKAVEIWNESHQASKNI